MEEVPTSLRFACGGRLKKEGKVGLPKNDPWFEARFESAVGRSFLYSNCKDWAANISSRKYGLPSRIKFVDFKQQLGFFALLIARFVAIETWMANGIVYICLGPV